MNDIDINQSISKLQAMVAAAQGQPAPTVETGGVSDFGKLLQTAVDKVNDAQQQSEKMAASFEKGDSQADLTEVMVALQKAKISFQAMVEVRNKLVVAYQDIMNMQI